jgi:SAM-dependent methyltransferase
MTAAIQTTDDMSALKTRLKAMWMSGDYGRFATFLEPGAMEFFPRLGIAKGERVLDVACGAGQLSFPAARLGALVTGVDIASNLIEQAKARASAEGLTIDFQEGDAESLDFPDASFDLVHSLIGAMFAPRPDLVAQELKRVCRPGGRIVMGNWTPGGFIGQMFKVMGKHVPPPAGMPSPLLWGDEPTLRARLHNGTSGLQVTKRMYPFRYPFPPADVVEFFRAWYGPTNRAFATLDAEGQAALRADLVDLWSSRNTASDGGTAITGEYLEVTARRT